MTAPHARLNKASKHGATQAETHLPALERAYGRALRAAGRRAAARLRQTQPVTAAANPKPPDWQPPPTGQLIDAAELANDTQRKTAKLHKQMLAAAAGEALRPFGIRFDITAPTSEAVLQQFADRIAATIESAIAEQVTEAIQKGYANGDSVYHVAQAIQAATDAISKPRAAMLARSDLNGIANSGSLLAASISGAADTKTWVTAGDELVRETHADADGQTVGINDVFDVGGESALYPGDPELSWEESASCRCVLTYGEPLTASAALNWSDLWDGHYAPENDPLTLTNAVTSGGEMTAIEIERLTLTERDELAARLAQPLTPQAERLARVRDRLKTAGHVETFADDELAALLVIGESLLPQETLASADTVLLAAAEGGTPWQATLCVAGVPTVDSGIKRLLSIDGGSWLPLPLPLALMDDSPHADMITSSPLCGRIDAIWMAGNVCQASGVFFDSSDDPAVAAAGSRAAAIVSEMQRMGISVDLVDTEVELRVWADGAANDLDYPNDPIADVEEGPAQAQLPPGTPTDDQPMDVGESYQEPEYIMCFDRWVIAGATICPVQALTQATISLVAAALRVGQTRKFAWYGETTWQEPLTASAAGLAPAKPPRAWFDIPEADEPTPLTVTDEGQVYGHMGLWNSCHTGFADQCVPPPKSPSDYSGFHLGAIPTAEGDKVEVGTLTMDTGHAGKRLSAERAVAHYDDTGTAAAYVRASDGRYGIWVCGALSARLDAGDAQALMAAKPSGDWREIFRGYGRDMIAALMVNVPGFVVPRTLVAAGMPGGDLAVEFSSECVPCEEGLARQLAVLAASADGIAGLAALVA